MARERSQTMGLQEIMSLKGKAAYYVEGQLLSISDVSALLEDRSKLNGSGSAMLKNLKEVNPHHFQRLRVSFPITSLRHDTDWDSVQGICNQEGFTTKQHEHRPYFNDLSFWSVTVSSGDTETGSQEAYKAVTEVVTPNDEVRYRKDIRDLVTPNSPAFVKTSPYGNFRFTFPLSDLLSWYKSQYCRGAEPQLRILGTDIYRQEIAHYIVVSSPDSDQFKDLPEVPRVTSPGPSHSVYWKEGTLYWRPESTSKSLKVMITEDGSVVKKYYQSSDPLTRDKTYSVWNHLVFTFHIPKQDLLKIPKQDLLKNLTPCGAGKPYLGKEDISLRLAEERIHCLKNE